MAHAVGAGNAMGPEVANVAIIVKMIRVMLLIPVLFILGYWVALQGARALRSGKTAAEQAVDGPATASKGKIAVPWFALWFLAVIVFNSFDLLPEQVVSVIDWVCTFLLTIAMAALGAETSIDKFKKAGAKPFILAFILYAWLLIGGWALARYLAPMLL